ncbi:MAG: alpha/beta hydrolase [Sinimarinibacterium sp.]|jgi:pimeloyl-ACP methyl ester carboxylesterase
MDLSSAYPPPQFLRLADGRRLAWYEYGDPDGKPCIYTTGSPASGLIGVIYDETARKAGVRWISVDKPGYGHSDPQPRRRLLDWPCDIAALADHLGFQRFANAGQSGGGPHALALAHALPQRITVTLVVAGMGPATEDWVRDGMRAANRRMFWIARHAPWLMRLFMSSYKHAVSSPKRRERFVRRQLAGLPPADRAWLDAHPDSMQLQFDALEGAFRQGTRAAADEMRMFARDWGCRLADIKGRVLLWHGTEDASVPVAVARHIAAQLPDCEAHFLDGVGHGMPASVVTAIVEAVRAAS